MRINLCGLFTALLSAAFLPPGVARGSSTKSAPFRFEATIPAIKKPVTGRLIVILSKSTSGEPRYQVYPDYTSQQAFGVDVDHLAPGASIVVDKTARGFPLETPAQVPAGDYNVQAVFNVYEPFHLANGKTVWLPPDKGEGQSWNAKPGNPLSKPRRIHIDPSIGGNIHIALNEVIPPIADNWTTWAKRHPAESRWVRYVRIRSAKLSAFWGRDMYLSAIVLLPDGWAKHSDAHYPVVIHHDHFQDTLRLPVGFRSTPPGPKLTGQDRVDAEYAYKFFQDWTSGRLPRVILVTVQTANPYYDDSYAVNSANLGPYGDAINYELLPKIEHMYRGIGQGWARAVYGSSTGGWEALATQVFYPDMYNGAWVNCPDPVDFHAYQTIDLYHDRNAYHRAGPFTQIPIGDTRKIDGNITSTTALSNRFESMLGTHGRSGGQWDIWQAVFSPNGKDGYPQPIYDQLNGNIDKSVAAWWHGHYDLDAIIIRGWPRLGPKLQGKLHFAVGDSDTFFLNNAVHLLQGSLEKTSNPHSDATFNYGPRQPHGYSGDPSEPVDISDLTMVQRFLPPMVEHMLATAPKGADTKSWRY